MSFDAFDTLELQHRESQRIDSEIDYDVTMLKVQERFGTFLALASSESEKLARLGMCKSEITNMSGAHATRILQALAGAHGEDDEKKDDDEKEEEKDNKKEAATSSLKEMDLSTRTMAGSVFVCPDCFSASEHLGQFKCAGCDTTWNTWRVEDDSNIAASSSIMYRPVPSISPLFNEASVGQSAEVQQIISEHASTLKVGDKVVVDGGVGEIMEISTNPLHGLGTIAFPAYRVKMHSDYRGGPNSDHFWTTSPQDLVRI